MSRLCSCIRGRWNERIRSKFLCCYIFPKRLNKIVDISILSTTLANDLQTKEKFDPIRLLIPTKKQKKYRGKTVIRRLMNDSWVLRCVEQRQVPRSFWLDRRKKTTPMWLDDGEKQRVGYEIEWKVIKVNNIIIWILFRMRIYFLLFHIQWLIWENSTRRQMLVGL